MTGRGKTSSFCQDGGCVRVARECDDIVVRDDWSQEVRFSLPEWESFIAGVRNDEFDVDRLVSEPDGE